MDRPSSRVPAAVRRFTIGILTTTVLLLPACGSEPGGGDAALASAIPEGRAECRRFTTCVPENPCHTGWVTGCRRNVPICTDIGGWLSNGTTCGEASVCHMGECSPCAAGASCPILDMYGNPDPCRAGAIACGTGQPVCEDVGPSPDGTACAWGVCVAGQCTWCQPGAQCTVVEDPCHFGALTCETGPVCVATEQPVPDGWGCGQDLYCQGGECVSCVWGTECTIPELPCWTGQTTCYAGPQCQPASPLPDGTPCPGGLCGGGACNACGPGTWCPSPNPCYAGGEISCGSGLCEPVGAPWPDGWVCGPAGETCTAGVCAGTPGANLLVRTASGGAIDVTGTTWTECYANEPSPGMSRLATDSFGAGTFTHTDVVFTSSLACTGPADPALGLAIAAQTLSYGDRGVGWDEGAPPGLATTVTASAVLLSGIDPGTGLPDPFKTLFFVNDLAAPQTLHWGGKDALAPDGFPATLATSGRPRAGAPLIVRTASGGSLDLTGTAWTTCFPSEPYPWTSRWTADVYGPGLITHSEEVYSSALDCTGPTDPALSIRITAAIEAAGDRLVGWTNGTPPVAGLPATVLATGVVISAVDPGSGTPITFRDLRFVDDVYESPRALYQGNGDGPLDLDGFPTQLANDPAREPLPVRTVTGTRTITFWPETGPTEPLPAWAEAVSALVPNGAGGYDVRPGTLAPDLTFSVPGVPEGAYVLRLDAGGIVYLAETDASTVDLGVDVLGRPWVEWAASVPLALSVTGLDPWTPGDVVQAYSATAPVAMMPYGPSAAIPAGATEWSPPAPTTLASTPLPDAALGDVVRVFQAKTVALGSVTYVAASSAGLVDVPTLTAAGPNAWAAALAPIGEKATFSSSWPAPLYEAHLANMGPGAVVQNQKIGVTATTRPEPLVPPFMGVYMGTPGPSLLMARAGAGFAGMDLVDLEYGRVLSWPWTEYRIVSMSARVNYTVGGTTYIVRPSISRVEQLATAPAADAAPLVSPPLDLRVNGLAASVPLAGVGTGPTISWSPPSVGTPTSYVVAVQQVPGFALVVSARTAGTSLRIPDGVLTPGASYFALVTARLAPAERLDAPLRNEFGASSADAVTAPFEP